VHAEDAFARLPVPARRAVYRAAYRLLSAWRLVRRPTRAGVKCVLRDGERVLFIRHTYGQREVWDLPGGGTRRREPPAVAAAREAREEIGIEADWRPLATITFDDRGETTLHAFVAEVAAPRLALDRGEIAHASWAPASHPPRPLSPSARAVLAELRAPPVGRIEPE
jgi:8-oxo-dGTP pyrophosphatase MutT (NUDIX family)